MAGVPGRKERAAASSRRVAPPSSTGIHFGLKAAAALPQRVEASA